MNSGATFANEARATRGRTASEVPPGPVPARAAARRLRPSQLPPSASTGCAVSQPAAGMRPLHVPVGRRSACAAPMPGKMASASGSGTVTSTYTPEATDKSTKIVFIQVMREILDGAPSKPSESDPNFTYQDADTTADFYHVDYVSGEKDPYYNGDDPGDIGTQGNAAVTPKVNATMQDTPHTAMGRSQSVNRGSGMSSETPHSALAAQTPDPTMPSSTGFMRNRKVLPRPRLSGPLRPAILAASS